MSQKEHNSTRVIILNFKNTMLGLKLFKMNRNFKMIKRKESPMATQMATSLERILSISTRR